MPDANTLAPGTICRIRIRDFLTYDNVQIVPRSHLNLVVGPNGTGKSTVVCAIFLVFGGNPKYLGRSTQMGDYIKQGKRAAHVQVEITRKSDESANPMIDLCITRGASTTTKHMLNGKEISRQKLLQVLQTYNIQVENLCQFLAQDRVVEFARQTNQELLENTEKSAGEKQLYERHQRLNDSVDQRQKLEGDSEKLTEKMLQIDSKLKQLKPDVDNAKCFQDRCAKLKQLKQKRFWLEYEEERSSYVKINEDKDRFEQLFNTATGQFQNAEKDVNRVSAQVDQGLKRLNQKKRETETLKQRMEESSKHVDEKREKIIGLRAQLENATKDVEEQQKNIQKVEEIIESLTDKYAQAVQQSAEIETAVKDVQNNLRQVDNRICQLEAQQDPIKQQFSTVQIEYQAVKREQDSIGDRQNQKLSTMANFNRYSADAYRWYLQNKGRFRGKVFVPFLAVNVPNSHQAKFVESVIPRREWFLFIFKFFSDMEEFLRGLKGSLGFEVPCAHIEGFRGPQTVPMSREMKQLGFYAYIADMIEAPQEVKDYLTSLSSLHKIPVGGADVENNLDNVTNRIPGDVRLFLTENKKISIRKSKYTGDFSFADNVLRPASLLTYAAGENVDVEVLQRQKEALESVLNQLKDQSEAIQNQIKEQEQEREKLRQRKTELDQRKGQRAYIAQQIKLKKANLAHLQSNLIDLPEKRRQMNDLIRRCLADHAGLFTFFLDCTKKYSVLGRERTELSISVAALNRHKDVLVEERRTKLADCNEKKEMFNRVKQEVVRKRDELRQLMKRALEAMQCTMGDDVLLTQIQLPNEIRVIFDSLPDTLQQIDEEMEDLNARLETMQETDADVIERYQALLIESQMVKREIDSMQLQLQHLEESTEDERTTWLKDLVELILKINENFSKFFELFGCAGEVELDKGENPMDCSKYGIKIKVRFRREDNEMRELTHQRQSGGERSVSTILYLLALQELTNVPFRCVDEINQGMDVKNERKMFNLIVKLMDRLESTSQYFMLTPKLLPNLQYSKHVNVMIVQNGSENREAHYDLESIVGARASLEQ